MSHEVDQVRRCPSHTGRDIDASRPPTDRRRSARAAGSPDTLVKSATRALEVIELFGIFREPLSVSDIAETLNIPQSSSSILLKAMNNAGFIDRDRQTRKYAPSIRSAFLGDRVHDSFFKQTSLLSTLDQLSVDTGCSVRLGVRNGLFVQDAHIAFPHRGGERTRRRPGTFMPICRDALGAMLLMGEKEAVVRAIVRHSNAVAEEGPRVRPEDFLALLDQSRRAGFSETANPDAPDEAVLSVRFMTPFEVPAAIGMCVPTAQLERDRPSLLQRMLVAARPAWSGSASAPSRA